MRRIAFAAPALAALGMVAGDEPKGDADRIQGTWVLASLEIEGRAVPEADYAGGKLVIEGDRYTTTFNDGIPPVTVSFAIDASTTPKSVDFTFRDGPRKGETIKGIYKIEGERIVMCRAMRDEVDRPKEFATRPGSGLSLSVWRRDRPDPDPRP